MRVHTVKVPDIGEGVAEVELVAWRVKVGDAVAEDQSLVDVMTDKATVEIPSPVAGTVQALGGEVGQVLAVGSELIRIETAGGRDAAGGAAGKPSTGAAPAAEGRAPAAAAQPPVAPAAPAVPSASAAGSAPAESPAPDPAVAPRAATAEPTLDRATQQAPARVEPGPDRAEGQTSDAKKRPDRPIASPAVRRRAWEQGIDLNDVRPSGTAGRIVQADLDSHAAPHPAAQRPAGGTPGYARASGEQTEAVTGLRRRIAQKMQDAKRRIPHFSYVEEVDVTEVEALRARLNEQGEDRSGSAGPRPRLTVLPFLVRAIVLAVRDHPQVNARFDDEAGQLTRFAPVHAGIATQTDSGLMVPVLRHAEALDLWQTAEEIARLADKARAGKATRDELTGSTITITSLGALGGIASTPVINHPEVAIVGVNRIVLRPVMLGGMVAPRRMMNLSSSFDHRIVDGLVAAQFVQRIKDLLEQPALLFIG